MSDIEIKNNEYEFKLRVCGIIINDNKVLVEKSQECELYALPGGHVEFKELTSETIIREVKEEIKIDIIVDKLFCIHENIFMYKTRVNNEIGYYYILKPTSDFIKDNFETDEIDKGRYRKHNFYWIPINELLNYPLYPKDVIKKLVEEPNSYNNIMSSKEI